MSETIIRSEYSEEMQQSYINYSMSVITARAVPDIRDGLKPVQRRVLYAMNELGLNADKPHRKSARIVGDAMGKYHPHGDSSIYDALVVLSQDFKKGMALVDGHGNFGSIEGDEAAAMRYTEARLKKFTQDVYLADLDKDVVNFVPNFDETEKEPEVLPVRVPNFLINGSEGIAVGMTTSVPTHNLAEVIDGMKKMIDNPDVSTEELMEVIKGPDFPTGGIVTNKKELLSIYETGKGKIKLRGRAHVEEGRRKTDKDKIVITEIPYTMIGANISKFLSDVAQLVETRKLPDIVDISNQSSKEGIKIVLELRKGADAERILQGLYKKTKLEDTFGVNMLAIVDGKPEVLGLRDILRHSLNFQVEINTRKYTTLLAREQAKKEIQEGLIRAVDVIDLIIEILRGSKNLKVAKECLVNGNTEKIAFRSEKSRAQASELHFTQAQATAILELRLSKLIGLEVQALQQEYRKTCKNIDLYRKILNDKKTMMKVISQDLEQIRQNFALERKTLIADVAQAVFEEAPAEEVPVVFTMNRFGYVKQYELATFERNEDAIREESRVLVFCRSTSKLCIFTDVGLMHSLKMQEVPVHKMRDKGVPIDNLTNLDSSSENILLVQPVQELQGKQILFVTRSGLVKRVDGSEFVTNKRTINSTKLSEQDKLCFVGEADLPYLVLRSKDNRAIRFLAEEVSVSKKASQGVRGVKLEENDFIEEVCLLADGEKCPVRIGKKRVDLNALPLKKRDGKPEIL